jgi:hypothetical protein
MVTDTGFHGGFGKKSEKNPDTAERSRDRGI